MCCGKKKLVQRGLQLGSSKWDRQFFSIVFGKTSIADNTEFIIIYIYILKNELRIDCGVFVPKITLSHIYIFSLQQSRKSLDFDIPSYFLEKLEVYFCRFVYTIYSILRLSADFLNINKIKNENLNPNNKLSD